jgi:hypothetical protein
MCFVQGATKPKRNRMREGTATSAAHDDDEKDGDDPKDDLDMLSSKIVNDINEEDKKLKKQLSFETNCSAILIINVILFLSTDH